MLRCAVLFVCMGLLQATAAQSLRLSAGLPDFLRKGDQLDIPVTLRPAGYDTVHGQLSMELLHPHTGVAVDGWFNNFFPTQYFAATPQEPATIRFPLTIPPAFPASELVIRFRTGNDSLVHKLPILSEEKNEQTVSLPPPLKQWRLLRQGKELPLQPHTDLLTGDTLVVECTWKKPPPPGVYWMSFPANLRPLQDNRPNQYGTLRLPLSGTNCHLRQRFVVSHDGNCSEGTDRLESKTGRAAFTSERRFRTRSL